ncbi:MAG: sulfite exporter TauE/SafE family protein [Solirubrobacterales bacterium]
MERERLIKLVLLGTAAGAFSGLFGVGGGTVIVPMLIAFLGYSERLATGTSLAAIVLIALFAVITFAFYGNVEWGTGLLLSIPAVGGVLVGTTLQQRVSERLISLVFAVVLVGVAIQMFFF